MNPSTATGSSPRLRPEPPRLAPTSAKEWEFRQVAGLMAGEVMDLSPGSYEFGSEETGTVGFTFNVGKDMSIIVVPGPQGILLDTERVWDPTPLNGRTINAGSARFQVGLPRPTQRDRRQIISGVAPQIHEPIVPVRVPGDTLTPANQTNPASSGLDEPTTFGGFLNRTRRGQSSEPDPARQLQSQGLPNRPAPGSFGQRLSAARTNLAIQRREQHPDPEEIARRARLGATLCWHRRSDHWHFGQVSIATADAPWQPRLDDPVNLHEDDRQLVQDMSTLPSVPITADLRVGPLGIVGSRAATLACARHIMTALATMSSPDHLAITVLADVDRRDSWDWAHRLPHTESTGESAMPVLIIDGIEQLNDNGFGMALTDPGGVGSVLLANDVRSLPPTCATVMILGESGTATILNHRDGTTISGATPHGISTSLAIETAASLSSAVPIHL